MPYHINTVGPGKFEVVDDAGKVAGTHPTRKQALAQLKVLYANVPEARKELFNAQEMKAEGREIAINALKEDGVLNPSDDQIDQKAIALLKEGNMDTTEKASSEPGDYLIAEDREHPTTWHLQVRTNGKPDHRLMGAAWAALHEGYRGNKYEGPDKGAALDKLKKLYKAEDMPLPGETESAKEAQGTPDAEQKQSILDRVIASLTGWKEGKRNSTPDGDRLQQIHDLAVLNGASCPMVMKEASGKLRWVLLSSNAFIDSDKEIISTKALEDDVARTDKAAAPYGPLRWWHMGAPDPIALNAGSGADIGDCDYRAMSGRVLIESGIFRNERIGEAIKERASTLAGSIGFFHPKDEPDSEGVYRNVVTFERSLLPRGKASNQLTALTVKGEESMATSKEKSDALAALLGDPKLAEAVIQQAEQTEKAADDRGLKYKEEKAAEPVAPAAPEVEVTTKAPTGEATAVPAHGESGLMKAFGLSADDDEATCKEKIGKVLNAMMDAKMGASAKETAEKEAGLNAKITALEASLKELTGDVPRGLQGFRAALSPETILKEFNVNSAATQPGSLDDVIDRLAGIKKA